MLSKQAKAIDRVFSERHDAYRSKQLRDSKPQKPQALPQDLDSLFFPEVGPFDKDVINELISEHMVLDDPTRLTQVISKFQEEAGCQVGE